MAGRAAATLLALQLARPLAAADWPGWRGAHRDGRTPETLPARLDAAPAALWRRPVGHGYAGPIVVAGRVVVLDDADGRETAHALDAGTGRVLWSTAFAPAWSDEFEPGPRCTPLSDGARVYVQSAQGELACLDLQDGRRKWGVRFADYGTVWNQDRQGGQGAATRRGHTGSPVLAGDRLIVQVGSARGASLVAFDRATGRELWRSLSDLTAYSSPVVGTLAGQEQVVAATCEGLVGVAVADGRELWRQRFKTHANRNVLTPILADPHVYFASVNTGLRREEIRPGAGPGETLAATTAWLHRDLGINLSTPVLVDGHLFGLGARKDYLCLDAATGAVRWSQPGFGEVAATLTDGRTLLLLDDRGEVRLVEARPGGWRETGRFQACGKTYSHPAWADGVLYVRDPREVVAYRFR
ncbi:MAG: PQQ-binding-like beta-propeller repeat protein [Verrucomicrobiota bacterium]